MILDSSINILFAAHRKSLPHLRVLSQLHASRAPYILHRVVSFTHCLRRMCRVSHWKTKQRIMCSLLSDVHTFVNYIIELGVPCDRCTRSQLIFYWPRSHKPMVGILCTPNSAHIAYEIQHVSWWCAHQLLRAAIVAGVPWSCGCGRRRRRRSRCCRLRFSFVAVRLFRSLARLLYCRWSVWAHNSIRFAYTVRRTLYSVHHSHIILNVNDLACERSVRISFPSILISTCFH